MDVRSIADGRGQEGRGCAVEVDAEDMSVERDSAQAKAVGELEDNDSSARGVNEISPMRDQGPISRRKKL